MGCGDNSELAPALLDVQMRAQVFTILGRCMRADPAAMASIRQFTRSIIESQWQFTPKACLPSPRLSPFRKYPGRGVLM